MKHVIYGFWKSVRFFCGYHNEEMKLKEGGYSVYYGCPNELDSPPCHNRLNLLDADKAIQHIMNVFVDDNVAGVVVDLNNHEWSYSNVRFKIIKADTSMQEVWIEVKNQKILTR